MTNSGQAGAGLSRRRGAFRRRGDWDTETIALSPDKKTLAAITNESGQGVLRLYDATTRKPLRLPNLPMGQLHGLAWNENSREFAVTIASARSPGDAYVLDIRGAKLTRWTERRVEGVDTTTFRDAEPIAWKSFDGLGISGFIVRPFPASIGPQPVLIEIQGAPEAQSRRGFSSSTAGTTRAFRTRTRSRSSRRRERTACRWGTSSPTTRATASRGRRTPISCSIR